MPMLPRRSERPFERETGPSPGNRSSDARGTYDERLNHVLRVATDVIARTGYEKATMREVAKAAGVSLAGLYHYVDGKERILFLIQFRAFNSLINGLREKLHGVTDPVEQLRMNGIRSVRADPQLHVALRVKTVQPVHHRIEGRLATRLGKADYLVQQHQVD